jgi:hypothetical protein
MVRAVIRGAAFGVSTAWTVTDTLVVRPTEVVLGRMSLLVIDRVTARVLRGPLVEIIAHDLVRYGVIERVTEQLLAGDALERVLDRAEAAGVAHTIADRLLEDGIAEQVAVRLLDGPELERIVELALESPGAERALTQIVDSRVVDETVVRVMEEVAERLPQSAAMWALIDEIAQSPAVTEAITQQGYGFADQVAGEVRERSRKADARLERAAWRLLRRRPRPSGPGEAPTTTGAT